MLLDTSLFQRYCGSADVNRIFNGLWYTLVTVHVFLCKRFNELVIDSTSSFWVKLFFSFLRYPVWWVKDFTVVPKCALFFGHNKMINIFSVWMIFFRYGIILGVKVNNLSVAGIYNNLFVSLIQTLRWVE